jgi:nucleoid-associated protein EbfC
MGSGFSRMKKQAKLFEAQYEKIQKEKENLLVTGVAGSDHVVIVLNGQHEIQKIQIKPECIDPNDPEGLEDLILFAYNDAKKQLDEKTKGEENLPFSMPRM